MKKRLFVGLVWFYVAWYAWMFVAAFWGLSELWGPVLGAAAGMFVAGDPSGRIWGRRSVRRPMVASVAQVSEPA